MKPSRKEVAEWVDDQIDHQIARRLNPVLAAVRDVVRAYAGEDRGGLMTGAHNLTQAYRNLLSLIGPTRGI